jgi:RNA polymerase sigma-70 factor (ECF subfamily)
MDESSASPSGVQQNRGEFRLHETAWRQYLEKTAGGDDRAFALFYDESSRLVHSVAMRFLADRADADEVTLDVFTQVWRSASVFDSKRGTVMAWLVTIARSRAIDKLRSSASKARKQDSIEDGFELVENRETPEQSSQLSQQRRKVQSALAMLPPDQRSAIDLAYFEDLSHQEISERLGLPLGTVKTRIRLGMIRLRVYLRAESALAGVAN